MSDYSEVLTKLCLSDKDTYKNFQCVCPVIAAFLRCWNDDLPDDERDALLRPLIPSVIGTRANAKIEQRRAMLAVDWLIRTHTSAWLRAANLAEHADALANLPEITDAAQLEQIAPQLQSARDAFHNTIHDNPFCSTCYIAHNVIRSIASYAVHDAAALYIDKSDTNPLISPAANDGIFHSIIHSALYVSCYAILYYAHDIDMDSFQTIKQSCQRSALDLVRRMIEIN